MTLDRRDTLFKDQDQDPSKNKMFFNGQFENSTTVEQQIS